MASGLQLCVLWASFTSIFCYIRPDAVDPQTWLKHNNEINEGYFEGDMMLTKQQWRDVRQRKVISSSSMWWPANSAGTVVVPYVFGDTVINQAGVEVALNRWRDSTCLEFPKYSTSASVNGPHLIFMNHASACASYVGRINSNAGQIINVTAGCVSYKNGGSASHEIGHALGLFHEQSRTDRDNYVVVNYANILSGYEHNFQVSSTTNFNVPYDYTSIMHYGRNYFTSNGGDTLLTKDPLMMPLIGQREHLSFMDIKIVNLQYNCIGKWLTQCSRATDPCQNGGYTNKTCGCNCPSGTSGANCETLNLPYTGALVAQFSPYSRNITTEMVISSPQYPLPVQTDVDYVHAIEAPAGCRVQLTFSRFLLYQKYQPSTGSPYCYFQILGVYYDWPGTSGTLYCGSDLSAGSVLESTGNKMILSFHSQQITFGNFSYEAAVKFVNCPVTTTTTTSTTSTTTTPTTTTSTTTTPTTTSTTTTPTTTSTTTTPTTTTSTTTTPSTTTSTTTTSTTTTPTTTTSTTTTPTTTTSTTTTPTTTTSTTTTSTTTFTLIPPTTTTSTATTTTTTPTVTPNTTNSGIIPLRTPVRLGMCHVTNTSNPAVVYYNSPFYPGLYRRKQSCTVLFSTDEPRYLRITPVVFQSTAPDQTNIFYVYRKTATVTRSMVGRALTLPSSSASIAFASSRISRGGKFSFKVEALNSNCHQIITLPVGATGTLFITSSYPAGTVCEWWLRAPVGRKVKVQFNNFNIGRSTCTRDYLLLSTYGDNKYISGTRMYCGTNTNSPRTVTSAGNLMNILVSGLYGGYGGMNATYSVV